MPRQRGIAPDALQRINYAMRVGDRILKCAVFLGLLEGDDFTPTSTGFLVCKGTPDLAFQHVVTTAHSVTGYPKLWLRVNRKDGTGHVIPQPITRWYFHPDSEQRFIDVAIAPTALPIDIYDMANVFSDIECITRPIIKRWDIGIGDELFYPGLFMSHVGTEKNLPLLRTGTIATMPDEMVMTGSGRAWLYLIESRSIGGHSGSPVFFNRMAPRNYVSEAPISLPHSGEYGHQYLLLGMLRSHFTLEETGEYVTPIGGGAPGRLVRANSGIATVVPAWEIVETIDQAELSEEREREIKLLREQSGDKPD